MSATISKSLSTTRRLPIIVAAFLCALLGACTLHASNQTIQIVVDNDFAVFAGTSNSVTRLLYQNNVSWQSQIDAAASFTISLQGSENYIYLLALGGGGTDENISGLVNGVNIATLYTQDNSSVRASSNIAGYLSNYGTTNNWNKALDTGTYQVTLAEVQNALATATWTAPTINSTQYVIQHNPYSGGVGFSFPTGNAVLYKITAEDLNISTIPEPTSAAFVSIFGIVLTLGVLRRGRKVVR